MKKKSFKKKLVIILILVAVISFGIVFMKATKKDSKPKTDEVKKEDVIQTKEFDYTLYDNKSDLYKDYFAKLKEELLKDEVNEDEYAKIISELFAIDFYSLNDKVSSTDVGGLDFIYEGIKENFVLKATDTIYKFVQSNVYGDRNQELPTVSAVEVKLANKTPVTIGELSDQNGYNVTLSLTYEKDMGYPKDINLKLVHVEKKLFIVEVK